MRTIASFVLLAVAMAADSATGAPQPGQPAPDFRLQDQNNKWHTLADYRGQWVVLFFYPKADTPGCTTEACEFRDNIFAYEEKGAVVMGVSLDDVRSQKEFADKYHLPYPLLSDARRETASAYGVLTRFGSMQVAARQTFVINPEGQIAKHYAKVDPKTHSKQVLADLSGMMDASATVF